MAVNLHHFANPKRFFKLARIVQPWLWLLFALTLALGLYGAWFAAPADYQQGETVRIMYIHVPAAWMSMFVYATMALAAFIALVWRHGLAEIALVASVPIGASFTFVALVTGSLWGKPMWGTWWEWDGRMTSVLILFFLYLAIIATARGFDDPGKGRRIAAILTLLGAALLPVIKYSVDWWETLHQPASVFRADGPTIDWSMLWPLLVMAFAAQLLYVSLLLMRMRVEVLTIRLRAVTWAQLSKD